MDQLRHDNLAHIDRLGLCHRVEDVCPVCGREFYRTQHHVYKHSAGNDEIFYCSYTCFRSRDVQKKEEAARIKEQKRIARERDALQKQIDDAQKRVDVCRAKVADAKRIGTKAPVGSRERSYAKDAMREWREKRDIALKDLRRLRKKMKEKYE